MPLFTSDLELSDDYPTIEPSLKLDFANSRALDPRITFLRQSIATYVGEDGLIKIASENEPRFDHDPVTGESLGLLIEESRTNDITQSNASNWSNSGVSKSTNTSQDVSPEGLNTATIVSESTNNGLHRIKSPNISFSNLRTFSIWIKRNSGTRDLYLNAIAIMGAALNFDFDTETLGSTTGTVSFERHPNQWYRFILTGTGTGVTNGVYVQFTESGDESDDYYVGDASNKFLVWGAQLEGGSFVTSHIPTSGSTATRAVDTAQINGIQFHNPSEFVLYAAGRSNTGASDISNTTTECLVSLGDTTNDYRFMLRKYRYNSGSGINTGFSFRYRNVADGINMDMFPNYFDGQADGYDTTTIAPIWNDSNIHRSALAFEAGVSTDNIRGCADGTLVVPAVTTPGSYSTVSNPGPYTQATTLQIGSGVSAGPFNGTISEVRYYPKRLTNVQLQTLTQ